VEAGGRRPFARTAAALPAFTTRRHRFTMAVRRHTRTAYACARGTTAAGDLGEAARACEARLDGTARSLSCATASGEGVANAARLGVYGRVRAILAGVHEQFLDQPLTRLAGVAFPRTAATLLGTAA
jgi:hypothetical protein